MHTGTSISKEVPKLVENFLKQGYENIEIMKDSYGQWIIKAKD